MAEVSRSKAAIRRPLEDALAAELGRLDRQILRIWTALFAVGVGGSVLLALFVSRSLGLVGGATGLAYLVFFAAAGVAHDRGRPVGTFVAVVEGVVPWSFSLLLVLTQGPVYAMGSWVPPMLF